jgi:hypothetical protein
MFDQEQILPQIADRLAEGIPLEKICRELPGTPTTRTIRRWIAENPTVSSVVAHAREIGYDAIAWRLRDVARNVADAGATGDTQRDRLIVETDLKLLACWDSKRYGAKVQQDVDLTVRVAIADPTRQLRNAATTQPALAGEARTVPALEHSGPVSALAVGALVQPNRGEDPSA